MKWKCEGCSGYGCEYESEVDNCPMRCPLYEFKPDWKPVIEQGMWGKFWNSSGKPIYGEVAEIKWFNGSNRYRVHSIADWFMNFKPLEKPEELE